MMRKLLDVGHLTGVTAVNNPPGGVTLDMLKVGMVLLLPWGGAGEAARVTAVDAAQTRVKLDRLWLGQEVWVPLEEFTNLTPICLLTLPEGAWEAMQALPEQTAVLFSDNTAAFVSGKRWYDAVTNEPLLAPLYPEVMRLAAVAPAPPVLEEVDDLNIVQAPFLDDDNDDEDDNEEEEEGEEEN
jgi:hypothetical protein